MLLSSGTFQFAVFERVQRNDSWWWTGVASLTMFQFAVFERVQRNPTRLSGPATSGNVGVQHTGGDGEPVPGVRLLPKVHLCSSGACTPEPATG